MIPMTQNINQSTPTTAVSTAVSTDMTVFSDEQIKRAGEILGCQLNRDICIRALIIQQDTGLSLARGEISIVPFNGRPAVFINKQGYLAYANRQPQFEGLETGTEVRNGETYAHCTVYRSDRKYPTRVEIKMSEFCKKTPVWAQMPEHMLKKTATSLALREAFPILNGTLTEEELDAPYQIQRRSTDIDIAPAPAPAPQPEVKTVDNPKVVPEPEKAPAPAPAPQKKHRLYSAQQAQVCLENFVEHGYDISVFTEAKLEDGNFNADLIDESFKVQRSAQQDAAREKSKQTRPRYEPSPELQKDLDKLFPEEKQHEVDLTDGEHAREVADKNYPRCRDCGERVEGPEQRDRSLNKFGVVLCSKCYFRRFSKK